MKRRIILILMFCFFLACYEFPPSTSDGGLKDGDDNRADLGNGGLDTRVNPDAAVSHAIDSGANTDDKKAHTITGTVFGEATVGITLSLTGASAATATTDKSGNFAFSGLVDGKYTITPSLSGYFFTPVNRAVTVSSADVMGVDFTAAVAAVGTYGVSGTLSGAVVAGVTVSLTGDNTATVITDESGGFTFSNLVDGEYIVTPYLDGYLFSPPNKAVTVNGANTMSIDFTATAETRGESSISGVVTGATVADIPLALAGASTASTTTDESGYYIFDGLIDGRYTVTPSLSGYLFFPENRSVTINRTNVSGVNFSVESPDSCPTLEWFQKFPSNHPSARPGHALATLGNKVVLFGGWSDDGDDGTPLNDTWEWDGSNWSQKSPSNSPPGRYHHAMATLGNRVVLFGGRTNDGYENDTWEWDGSRWAEKFPSISPPSRENHAMATLGSVVVLFGGYSSYSTDWVNDTWEWDGSNWSQKSPSNSPPGSSAPALATLNGKVVLFGGTYSNETWEWDGSNWSQKSLSTNPPGRENFAMATLGTKVILFSGKNSNDTWEWDGSRWAEKFPSSSPPGRENFAMAALGNKVVLFGGYFDGSYLNDTWERDSCE